MARLIKARDADCSFDLLFWERVGAEGRFSAAWEMISEVQAVRGKDSDEPRLQRSGCYHPERHPLASKVPVWRWEFEKCF
jgi:hypothetical protein